MHERLDLLDGVAAGEDRRGLVVLAEHNAVELPLVLDPPELDPESGGHHLHPHGQDPPVRDRPELEGAADL